MAAPTGRCPFCLGPLRPGQKTERVAVPTNSGPDMITRAHADPCPGDDDASSWSPPAVDVAVSSHP